MFWTWKSRRRVGRPAVAADVRALIRTLSEANPLWGAPRIHGELLKLAVEVSQATVAKYMVCREAFQWDDAPRYLVHDRDTAFYAWATTASTIGSEDVITAARSPWQNAYAERLIGSIRRECLDHIIVGNARGLRPVLNAYVEYYLKSWTHLSLSKDAPISRPVASPSDGEIVAIPQLGGLHYRYERRAA